VTARKKHPPVSSRGVGARRWGTDMKEPTAHLDAVGSVVEARGAKCRKLRLGAGLEDQVSALPICSSVSSYRDQALRLGDDGVRA